MRYGFLCILHWVSFMFKTKKTMKKYIYIGQENGKEVVIETSMDKADIPKPIDDCFCFACIKHRNYWEEYEKHISKDRRIEVIGTIPAYWKKGKEVQVKIITDYCFLCQSFATSQNNCSHDTVAIPIDKADTCTCNFATEFLKGEATCPIHDKVVELKLPNLEKILSNSNPELQKKVIEIMDSLDKAVEPEHIADTGKMIDNRGKYVIIDLRNMDFMKTKEGVIRYYDTESDASNACGMYEVENAWVCKLIYNHIEP